MDFVPILVLTADATDQTKLRALGAGANDFLTKPFQLSEVTLRVANLLYTSQLHRNLQRHSASLEHEVDGYRAVERAQLDEQREIARRTQRAIDGDDLVMVYQPIVDTRSGGIVGAEALARFASEPGRPPDVWFQEAAQVELGTALEITAIDRALGGCASHLPADAFLSVNASAATLRSPALLSVLDRHAERDVVVELTEHEAVGDYRTLIDAMRALRELGLGSRSTTRGPATRACTTCWSCHRTS